MTTATCERATRAWAEEFSWLCRTSRVPRIRTMREFAEEEVIIPDGPYEGRRFRCDRQPFSALLFDAIDSGQWNRFAITGPSQSGKTLCGSVIPVMYHLFEHGETVIFGLPDMDMAGDKWREDLEPVISRSRYRDLIPRSGAGSRGGKVSALKFRNGATLRFMSGGGGDKSRAGFTSRVLVITEVDGMDEAGGASREADKIAQLEARTRAYGARKRVYMECTVSIEEGRTWREYKSGTESRIILPCEACGAHVSPEREHLSGWQDAETAVEARATAAFCCPGCGEIWTEDARKRANSQSILVHRGQEVGKKGAISGDSPATDTLGFRWSAVNNQFVTPGDVGMDEWKAQRSSDEENAEKEMLQFVWALPHRPSAEDATPVEAAAIQRRVRQDENRKPIPGFEHGRVPDGTEAMTMAVDLGKWLCHWVVIAWCEDGRSHVVDYGRTEVSSDQLGVEKGLLLAMREIQDMVIAGWPDPNDNRRKPDQVWIDSGYQADVVYDFCREAAEPKYIRFRPARGLGEAQDKAVRYSKPKTTGAVVKAIGEGYHIVALKKERLHLVEVNADHWKSWIHQRLVVPIKAAGALTIYTAPPNEHMSFAKHLTAEKQVEEFIAGKGTITRWERVRKNNHWFDAAYNAAAAGHFCGVRLIRSEKPTPKPRRERRESARFQTPSGQPFLATER